MHHSLLNIGTELRISQLQYSLNYPPKRTDIRLYLYKIETKVTNVNSEKPRITQVSVRAFYIKKTNQNFLPTINENWKGRFFFLQKKFYPKIKNRGEKLIRPARPLTGINWILIISRIIGKWRIEPLYFIPRID